jgi:hypothetical protein
MPRHFTDKEMIMLTRIVFFLLLIAGFCYGDYKFLNFPYPNNLLKGTNVIQFLDTKPSNDCSTNRMGAVYAQAPCATFDGTAYLAVSNMTTSVSVVSKQGTATVTCQTNRISFGSGTCWDLLLSNGQFFPMQEGRGTRIYDVNSGIHGALTSFTESLVWANSQDTSCYFATNGGAKAGRFLTTSTVTNLGLCPSSNLTVDAWFVIDDLSNNRSIYTAGTEFKLRTALSKIRVFLGTNNVLTVSDCLIPAYLNHVKAEILNTNVQVWVNGTNFPVTITNTLYTTVASEQNIGGNSFAGGILRCRVFSSTPAEDLYAIGINGTTATTPTTDIKMWKMYGTNVVNEGSNGGIANLVNVNPIHYPAQSSCNTNLAFIYQSRSNSVSVSSSDYTAEERTSDGNMTLDSSDLELARDGDLSAFQTVGIGFTNVIIPKGATVTNAYLRFFAKDNGAGTGTNVTVRFKAELTNSAAVYTTSASNITRRYYTTASCYWVLATNIPDNTYFITPQMKDLVQEVVNLSGWTSGNTLSFKCETETNNPNFRNTDGEVTLIVEYAQPTPSCGLGIPVLNPTGYVHNGGPEKIKQQNGGLVGQFTNANSYINTGLSNWTSTATSVYKWTFISTSNTISNGTGLLSNRTGNFDNGMHVSWDGTPTMNFTVCKDSTNYTSIAVSATNDGISEFIFYSDTGTMEVRVDGSIKDSDVRTPLIGFSPVGSKNIEIGRRLGGDSFKGFMGYASFEIDGVKQYEYKLGNISGTNCPDSSGNNRNGLVVNGVVVTNYSGSVYVGVSQLKSNPFWTTNNIASHPRSYSDIITNTSQTIVVTTNDHLIKQLITKGQP